MMRTFSVYEMTVVKERNVYRYQHVTSSHKPIIQAEDLSGVKYHFDKCISTCGSEASDETEAEYEAIRQEQKDLQSLKNIGLDVVDWVARIVTWPGKGMIKNLGTLPDLLFLNFVKFTIVNFLVCLI
ncbi:hypothetical protein RMCBS344292_04594 [Rhizopus microsporus]|nr:hypothetical protein RMCBS344292_04594 [Rhizopus microsporus]